MEIITMRNKTHHVLSNLISETRFNRYLITFMFIIISSEPLKKTQIKIPIIS